MSIGDVCMVHRYLYYVRNKPIISDYHYDILENEAKRFENSNHPINLPGSDLEKSYGIFIINKANELIK